MAVADVNLVNLAMGRPCEPSPSCAILFDGNLSTSTSGEMKEGPFGRAFGSSNSDSTRQRNGLTVYLNGEAHVARIVVLCGRGRTSFTLLAKLLATQRLLVTSHKPHIGHGSGASPNDTAKLLVAPVVHSPPGQQRDSEGDRRESPEAELVRLEFELHGLAAAIVSLRWGPMPGQTDAPSGLCGPLPVAEVSLLAFKGESASSSSEDESPTKHEAAIARRQSTLVLALPHSKDLRDISMAAKSDVVADVQSPSRPSFFLEPKGSAADLSMEDGLEEIPGRVIIYLAAVIAVSLAVVPFYAAVAKDTWLGQLLLCRRQPDGPAAWIGEPAVRLDEEAGAVPADDVAPSSALLGGLGSGRVDQVGPGPVYFWIGDDTDPELPEATESPLSTPRPGTEGPSPLSPARQPESEPEVELYPSTPKADMATVLPVLPAPPPPPAGVAYAQAMPGPLPPPVPPAAAVDLEATNGHLPATPAAGRVLLLYASPLCYNAPGAGPRPMAALPFEQEWALLQHAQEEAAMTPLTNVGSSLTPRRIMRRVVASLAARPMTSDSLQRALTPCAQMALGAGACTGITVLHLSAHGTRDSLVLEDGKGGSHMLSCSMLQSMLSLRATGRKTATCPRLVVLNACRSEAVGACFGASGVAHVVCAAADLRDSWGKLFLKSFYFNLFQGRSVASSFNAAVIAVECEHGAHASSAFRLLPEEDSHDEVLFPIRAQAKPGVRSCLMRGVSASSSTGTTSSSSARRSLSPPSSSSGREESPAGASRPNSTDSERPPPGESLAAELDVRCFRSPRLPPRGRNVPSAQQRRPERAATVPATGADSLCGQPVPSLPDDFLGRIMDTWSVMQYLHSTRRAVVVCGDEGTFPGVGKSAVLLSVHRAIALRQSMRCIAVELKKPQGAMETGWWISQVQQALKRVLREEKARGQPWLETSKSVGCAARRREQKEPEALWPNEDFGNSVEALVGDLNGLAAMWQRSRRLRAAAGTQWASSFGGSKCEELLLILDNCDGLLEDELFEQALSYILRMSASTKVLIGAHQRLVRPVDSFKVVHHPIGGLSRTDSARLFLNRSHRKLRWGEIQPRLQQDSLLATSSCSSADPTTDVAVTRQNAEEVHELVAALPALSALGGNPRAIINLADQVHPGLACLADLPV